MGVTQRDPGEGIKILRKRKQQFSQKIAENEIVLHHNLKKTHFELNYDFHITMNQITHHVYARHITNDFH